DVDRTWFAARVVGVGVVILVGDLAEAVAEFVRLHFGHAAAVVTDGERRRAAALATVVDHHQDAPFGGRRQGCVGERQRGVLDVQAAVGAAVVVGRVVGRVDEHRRRLIGAVGAALLAGAEYRVHVVVGRERVV